MNQFTSQLKYFGLAVCGIGIGSIFLTLASSRPLDESTFTFGVIAICGAVLSLWR